MGTAAFMEGDGNIQREDSQECWGGGVQIVRLTLANASQSQRKRAHGD